MKKPPDTVELSAWDQFWFQAPVPGMLTVVRIGACLITLVYFLATILNADLWWNPGGWQDASLGRKLVVASEGVWPARFRLSPLWLVSSSLAIRAWCLVGAVLTLVALTKRYARGALALTALCLLCLAQRSAWSTGTLEPWLIALLSYLAIYDWHGQQTWTQSFSSRLIQVHLWLLLAAALVSQLSASPWWSGEAVWWLASTNHSHTFRPSWLTDRILLVNLLTHAITITTVFAVYGLWPFVPEGSTTRRRLGVMTGVAVAIAYALAADQLLYGIALGVSTLAFWPKPYSASKP